jgi:hypothetical protein
MASPSKSDAHIPELWRKFKCPKCGQDGRLLVSQFIDFQVHKFARRALQNVVSVYTCTTMNEVEGQVCGWQTTSEDMKTWLEKTYSVVRGQNGSKDDFEIVKP